MLTVYRGFDGISGWGWLEFRPRPDLPDPAGVPAPGSGALLFGLAALGTRRRTS